MSKKLEELQAQMRATNAAIIEELKQLYPTGSKWLVLLRDGQVKPSEMTVRHHRGGVFAMVGMEMPSKAQKYRQSAPWKRFRADVSPERILGPA